MEHYIISISAGNFPVRVFGERREVKVDEKWINHSDFVEQLRINQDWDSLYDLAIAACRLVPEKVNNIISRL